MSGNDVVIRVSGDNKAKPAFTEAKKDIGELTKQTEFFGNKAIEAKKKVDDLTRSLMEVGQDGTLSVEQVVEAEKKLIKELQAAQRELAQFEKMGKGAADEIAEALEHAAEEAAQLALSQGFHAGEVFTDGMLSSFKSATPALIGGLVAVGVMATPTIGAMIGGAVLGGVGMGGMIGGIAMAARDPRVKQAAEEFANNALPNVDRLGASFVEPTIGALGRLDDKFRNISMGPLLGSFESLSREIAPFTLNLEKAADRFIPGFTRALKAAEPVVRTIGNELPGFAADLTAMFDAMSEDPDGAVMGIKKLMDVTGDTLVLFGKLVGWMEQTYETGVIMGEAVTGVMEDWFHWLGIIFPPMELLSKWMGVLNDDFEDQNAAADRAYDSANQFAGGLDDVKTAAEEAAEQMEGLNKAIDDLLGRTLSWEQLQVRWHEGLRDLNKELMNGAKTLSLHTEEGLKNRDAMLSQIGVAVQMRDDEAKRTGDLEAANAHYQQNIDFLRKQGEAAGFAKGELDQLFAPFKNGPVQVAFEFLFSGLLEGLTDMERALRLRELLNDFSVDAGGWSSQRNRERRGMASGGISSGGLTMMNEQGWEMVELPNGARVIPHGTSQAMLSGASGGARQPIIVQLIDPMTGNVTRQAMIDDALSRGVDPTTVAGAYP